jgi:dihydroorotate dehydrogenase
MKNALIKKRNQIIRFFYTKLLRPVFFLIDPELIHNIFIAVGKLLGSNLLTRFLTYLLFGYRNRHLNQKLAGITFKNPVGLAAGFDKDGKMTNIIPATGFGFEEIGSVTGKPCAGNPKPRLWRHTDKKALRVYYGLVNEGAEAIASRLRKGKKRIPLGVSIAKTNCESNAQTKVAIADYVKGFKAFTRLADYYAINISCPNAYGGQPFTSREKLDKLLTAIRKIKTRKPVFIKLSPDLTDKEISDIISLAKKHDLAGFICTNLSKKITKHGPGGMSGKAVEKSSNALIKKVYKKTRGQFIIMGVGGIFTPQDAYKKIRLGANLVQLITGMIYEGPQSISEINRGLAELLEKDGFKNIGEAVGLDA